MKQHSILTILLLISLFLSISLNVWLWLDRTAHNNQQNTNTATNILVPLIQERHSEAAPTTPNQPVDTTLQNQHPNSTAHLISLLQEENWPALTVALRDYLKQYPSSIDALLIEAELIARTEPLAVALVHYYSLLDLPLNTEQRQTVKDKIEQRFENATERLRFDRAWDLLAELLEPLIQIAPNERRYLVLLAEAYAQQTNGVLMENALAGLALDDPAITSIRQIFARNLRLQVAGTTTETDSEPQHSGQRITRIPLEQLGNQFIVNLEIDSRPLRLMLDTGASTTAITAAAWSRISSRVASKFIGVFKVNTAAGFIQAPMFSVKTISMGDLRFDDVSVMIIPSDMVGSDTARAPQGLLGMNILSLFHFQIDQQNAQLLLSQRP